MKSKIVLDLFAEKSRVGIIKNKKIIWTKLGRQDQLFSAFKNFLEKYRRLSFGLLIWVKPEGESEAGGLTWSGVRRAVGLINTLAFAKNLVIQEIAFRDLDNLADLEQKSYSVYDKPNWLSPTYNREPNITTAK